MTWNKGSAKAGIKADAKRLSSRTKTFTEKVIFKHAGKVWHNMNTLKNMPREMTSFEVVDSSAAIYCNHANIRTQHLFKQTLYQLIGMAKAEKSAERQNEHFDIESQSIGTLNPHKNFH